MKYLRIYFLSFSVIFLFGEFIFSNPSLVWVKQYNGTGNGPDNANSIAVDDSGNVYVTGESWGGSSSNSDYATVKYNFSGIQQWISRYNGPGNGRDYAVAVCTDKIRNVYVTGSSMGSGTNGFDFAIVKYDNAGVQKWVARYNFGTSNELEVGMCIDTLGNIYITGYNTGSNSIIRTIKYDSLGNQEWVATYDGPSTGSNASRDITLDKHGNILIACTSDSDYVTVKYNSSGILLWASSYEGPGNVINYARAIVTDSDANVFITGYSSSPNWVTVKYNSNGVQLWVKTELGAGESYDYAYDLTLDGSGNVYVTGSTTTAIKLGSDVTTRKYTNSGNLEWIRKYFGIGRTEYGIKVALDNSGDIVVAAFSYPDFLTLKYNPSGILLWSSLYGRPFGEDKPSDLAIDNSDNIYITGIITDSLTGSDYGTLKYSDLITGINPMQLQISHNPSLKQNYPNPFNPSTVISYSLSENSFVTLKIYDVLGNEVASLVNEKQNSGYYKYQFSTDNYHLSSGIYYYKLETGNSVQTKKMLLMK